MTVYKRAMFVLYIYIFFFYYTNDNKTQGIMEKSQWDLKRVRFQRRRLTRLDDFVHIYQISHNALLREFSDSTRKKKVRLIFSFKNIKYIFYLFIKESCFQQCFQTYL